MRVLVLQHVDNGHPWFLRELLEEVGGSWFPVHLHRGERLPERHRYDAVWAMGGAMQVWEEETHPWLADEKRFIRETVEAGTPFLGICLGHQLLAEAMGGAVDWAERPEVGVVPVEVTDRGAGSRFLGGAPPGRCLQWHKAEVRRLPQDATLLARSEDCPIQAMAIGGHALSLQYHVEIAPGTLPAWCESESAREALLEVFGDDGAGRFQRLALDGMASFNDHARRVFANWLDNARNALGAP